MMVEQVLKELLTQCLKYADLSTQPQKDSLHEKLAGFLEKYEVNFEEWAGEVQNGTQNAQIQITSEVTKFLQRFNRTGSTLNDIRFGGYR